MKAWLTRNKIIFETLVAASLTIMGVLVSIAAVIVSVNANKIGEEANKLLDQQNEMVAQQYELELFSGEPVFDVDEELGEDGIPYYVIKNTGAKQISEVTCTVCEKYPSSYQAKAEGTEWFPYGINVTVWNRQKGYDGDYDYETHSFHIPAYRKFQDNTAEPYRFPSAIMQTGLGGPVWVSRTEIEIKYKNYLKEKCTKKLVMEFYEGGAGRNWMEYSSFVMNNESNWERDILEIELSSPTDPVDEIRKAISNYLSERNWTPF